MKTLSEINQADYDKRRRAGEYETCVGQKAAATVGLSRILPQIKEQEEAIHSLGRIRHHIKSVPGDVVGPRGMLVADQVDSIADYAIKDINLKLVRLRQTERECRELLEHCEQRIKELEAEDATS